MILKDLENRIKHVDTVWLIKEHKPITRIVIIRRDEDRDRSLNSYLRRRVLDTSYERSSDTLKIRIR